MEIIIPHQVSDCINAIQANKTFKTNALKIYAALYIQAERADKFGYFPVPAKYLMSINKRYYKLIDILIENGIIEYRKRTEQDPDDLFGTITKKIYNKHIGLCMKYRFLIDISQGQSVDVEIRSNKNMRWYDILKNSLIALGYEPRIGRDTFGRRVHHPAIMNYKTELANRGFTTIDAKCSQPKLLYNIMKKHGIIDQNYFDAFEKHGDFYGYVAKTLNLNGDINGTPRDDAKEIFMYWVNSNGYIPMWKDMTSLFKEASQFIKKIKFRSYKDMPAYLQLVESKIWINDLLENIPVEFAIPVHDCLIVKDKEAEVVLSYCKNKYPEIDFEMKQITK